MEKSILMRTPLLTIDSQGEMSIFATPDQVSHWLEAQDVRDGEFRLFDCAGVEYLLSAETDSSPVQVGPPIGEFPDLVRQVAHQYLERLPTAKAGPVDLAPETSEEISRALAPFAR